MINIRSFLEQTFLFNSFSDKEIDILTASTSLKSVNKGEQIFSEGLEATAFFIVVSGKVKIYKLSPDGKEYTLHLHGPGEPVAEAAIFDSMTYPASCMALEDATLVRISREGFLDLIRKYPELSLKIMSGYSKRLRQFVAKIEELTLKDMKSRLAHYLLENSFVENGKTVCHLTHSKKELSSLLGTIPETLSRTLAFFKQQKIVSEKDNTILISDPEKLKLFSD
jgi:CRP/FNR family transcriptional regulator, dissimilatory nitrate respiration regulator